MASSAYNFTAELQVILSSSALQNARQQAQRALGDINANVNIGISSGSQAGLNNLNNSAVALRSSLRAMSTEAGLSGTAVRGLDREARQAADGMELFGRQTRLATQRFAAFTVGAGAIFGVLRSFQSAIREAIDFESQMVKLGQVGQQTQVSIAGIQQEITRLATSYGTSSKGLADVAVQFRQAGFSAQELKQGLEAVAKTDLSPSFGSMQKTADGVIALRSQFKLAGSEIEAALDSINSVSSRFAVESADIVKGIESAGGAFRAAGGNLNEFVAIFSTVRSTTRENADAIATGLRTIFTRLQRPDTIANLRELGVELQRTKEEALSLGQADLTGQFVGPLAAIQRLSQALKGLQTTDSRYEAVGLELTGGRPAQIAKLLPLLQDQARVQETLNTAQTAGISITNSAAAKQDALATQISRVKEEFLGLGRDILASSGFRTFIQDSLKLTSALIQVADAARPLIPLVTTLGTIRLLQGVGPFVSGLGRGPATRPFASGGLVPGHGDHDSVHALLTPGEVVINKQAARAVGYDRLEAINRTARFASGGVVGEVHPFGNFDPSDFRSFVADVRAEAARLKYALAADTKVAVEFAASGPVFHGFVDTITQAKAAARERISLHEEKHSNEIAEDLVGTRASRERLVAKGFLAPEAAEAIATGPIGKLTTAQEQSRVSRSERENRLRALEAYYQSREHLWDTVEAEPRAGATGLVPVAPDYIDAEFGVLPPLPPLPGVRGPNQAAERRQDLAGLRAQDQARYAEANEEALKHEILEGAKAAATAQAGFQRDRITRPVPSYDELHPEEAAYQRAALSQTHFPASAAAFRSRITEREELRAARAERQVVTDPLQIRARVLGEFGGQQAVRADYLRGSTGIEGFLAGVSPDEYTSYRKEIDRLAGSRPRRRVPPDERFGSFQDVVDRYTSEGIGRRGPVLSDKTKSEIADAASQRANADLLAATTRQVRVLNAGISGTEARRIAEEQLAKAAADGARVVTRASGQIVGLESNVNAVKAAGLRADGRSAFGGFVADRFGALPGAAALRQRFGDSRFFSGLSNAGFFGASVAGSYLSAGLDKYAGSAADAVGGGEGRFVNLRGGGGAVQGGLIGGAIGSAILPGLGTGIVAAIGALHGFTSSIDDAAKEIRDAKIGNAVTDLAQRLKDGFTRIDDARAALLDVHEIRQQTSSKAREAATSYFGGFDAERYLSMNRREERAALGPLAPAIVSNLQKQAEDLAKSNLGVQATELAGRLKEGGNGVNQAFLQLLASLRGVPLDAVLKDFTRNIVETQRSARLDQARTRVDDEQTRAVNSFGRLTQAVELAAAGLFDLQARAHSLTDVFSGRVSPTSVGGISEVLAHPGGSRREDLQALGAVAAPLGTGGQRLLSAGTAVNQLDSVLPSVLAKVVSRNPVDSEDFGSQTRSGVRAALGFGEGQQLPEQLQRGLEQVVTALQGMKLPDIVRQTTQDASGLSRKLTESFSGPVTDASTKIARLLEQQANRFIGELAAASQRAATIREQQDRLEQIGLAGTRQEALFKAQDLGRQHDALDFISLDQLNRPFNARQEQLVGVNGPQSLNPRFIAERLREVREQIGPATQQQQDVFRQTGGQGAAFEAAAKALNALKDRSNQLQDALHNLTDWTTRTAGAQEKLQNIQANRDSRLSYGEKFISAGFDERLRMNRGLQVLNEANNQRGGPSIRGFTIEDQQLAIQTGRALGRTKLTGFAGQPNAADLTQKLVEDFLGPFGALDAESRKQEEQLKNEILQGAKDAAAAQKELIGGLQTTNKDLLSGLKASQQEFLLNLRQIFTADKITDRTIQQGQVAGRLADLRGLQGQQAILARAGVTDDRSLELIQAARPDIEALAGAKSQAAAQRERTGQAIAPDAIESLYQNAYGSIEQNSVRFNQGQQTAFDAKSFGGLTAGLGAQGFQAGDIQKILAIFRQKVSEQVGAFPLLSSAKIGENKDLIKQSLRDSILTVGEEAAQRQSVGAAGEARQRLRLRPGLDVGAIEREIGQNGEGVGPLIKAAGAFDLAGNRLSTLDQRLASTTDEFNKLGNAIASLRKLIEQHAPAGEGKGRPGDIARGEAKAAGGFAIGGPVPGRPRGTDTVPAWLTPGEYVLPKDVYAKHKQLVHAMHHGRSHYMADGGEVAIAKGGPGPNPPHRMAIGSAYVAEPSFNDRAEWNDADIREQREMERQAALNPAGASAFRLLADKGVGTGHEYQLALALHLSATRVAAFAAQSRAAHLSDPGAAFGAGKAGIEAQQVITTRQAGYKYRPETMAGDGEHHGISIRSGLSAKQANALAWGGMRFVGGSQFILGGKTLRQFRQNERLELNAEDERRLDVARKQGYGDAAIHRLQRRQERQRYAMLPASPLDFVGPPARGYADGGAVSPYGEMPANPYQDIAYPVTRPNPYSSSPLGPVDEPAAVAGRSATPLTRRERFLRWWKNVGSAENTRIEHTAGEPELLQQRHAEQQDRENLAEQQVSPSRERFLRWWKNVGSVENTRIEHTTGEPELIEKRHALEQDAIDFHGFGRNRIAEGAILGPVGAGLADNHFNRWSKVDRLRQALNLHQEELRWAASFGNAAGGAIAGPLGAAAVRAVCVFKDPSTSMQEQLDPFHRRYRDAARYVLEHGLPSEQRKRLPPPRRHVVDHIDTVRIGQMPKRRRELSPDRIIELQRGYADGGLVRSMAPGEFMTSTEARYAVRASRDDAAGPEVEHRENRLFFPPVGRDTIPAMLRKGEYILTPEATHAIGHHNLDRMNHGGLVTPRYFADGGPVSGNSTAPAGGAGVSSLGLSQEATQALVKFNADFTTTMSGFTKHSQALALAFTSFGTSSKELADALKAMPSKVTHQHSGRQEVIINGADAIGRLEPVLKEWLLAQLESGLKQGFKDKIPEA